MKMRIERWAMWECTSWGYRTSKTLPARFVIDGIVLNSETPKTPAEAYAINYELEQLEKRCELAALSQPKSLTK